MPTKLLSKGEIETTLDFAKEINKPVKEGRYLEVIARLDAYIDSLVGSIVEQVYESEDCQELIESLEPALRHYIYFSGRIKLDLLHHTYKNKYKSDLVFPSKDLRKNIIEFKEIRNKVLHSEIGHYNLIEEDCYVKDETFQKDAKAKILEAIKLGKSCHNNLKQIIQTNAKIIKKKKSTAKKKTIRSKTK